MLQKYFSLQVNKQARGSCKNEQTDFGIFSQWDTCWCVFPLLRIPALALPILTAHADVGFLNDGSVNLWFSSEGNPIRVYKPAVAFKAKGISSDRGLSGLSHHYRGRTSFNERQMANKAPHCLVCRWARPLFLVALQRNPCLPQKQNIDTMKSPSCVWKT